MASVAVVIVSYRTPTLTAAAVRSALQPDTDLVVVIDNASGDDTVERVQGIGDTRLVLHVSATNEGFGAAANKAARRVNSEAVLFLNSDAELRAGAIHEMLGELRRWDGRALVGPRVVGQNGEVQPSAGLLPGPFDLTARALGLHAVARLIVAIPPIGKLVVRSRTAREYATAGTATGTIDTNMVSGACFAIGRLAFEELGGFDERFFMYFEDADLSRRATLAGMPIRYVPSAVITHLGGASSTGDYRFSPMHARSMRQYLEKWWGPPGAGLAILLLWLRLVGHFITQHRGARKAFAALRAALR